MLVAGHLGDHVEVGVLHEGPAQLEEHDEAAVVDHLVHRRDLRTPNTCHEEEREPTSY